MNKKKEMLKTAEVFFLNLDWSETHLSFRNLFLFGLSL